MFTFKTDYSIIARINCDAPLVIGKIVFSNNRIRNIRYNIDESVYVPNPNPGIFNPGIPELWDLAENLTMKKCWDRRFQDMQAAETAAVSLFTHLVWPHQPENPPGRPKARRISP